MSKLLYGSPLPKYDNKIRIFLTFECNLSCPYCFLPKPMGEFKYRTPQEWAEGINRIGKTVVFTGGEPTLYPEFYKLVNLIRSEITIIIYSNLEFNTKKFRNNVKRKVGFWTTYHPISGPPERFIKKYKRLTRMFDAQVHYLLTKTQKGEYKKYKQIFNEEGISLKCDDDVNDIVKPPKGGKICYKKDVFIAPDGERYQCVLHMKKKKHSLGNIIDEKLPEEIATVVNCDDDCIPGDLRCECVIIR